MGIENNNNPLKKKKELFLIATCMVWPFFFYWVFIPTHRTAFFFLPSFSSHLLCTRFHFFFSCSSVLFCFIGAAVFFLSLLLSRNSRGFLFVFPPFSFPTLLFLWQYVCAVPVSFFFFSSSQSFCSFCFSPPALMPLLKTAYKWLAMSFLFFGRQSLLKLFKQPRTCGNNYLSFLCGVFFFFLFFFPLSHRVLFSAIQ